MKYTNKAKLYLLAKYHEYEEAKSLYGLSKTVVINQAKTNSAGNLESIVNN